MVDIIRGSLNIGQTIRNVGRLREIVAVFAKHGFDAFISRSVTSLIPNFALPKSKRSIDDEIKDQATKDLGQIVGKRLRLCFEELGPAFVKVGQLIATREDIFDESFLKEMRPLRDQVAPVSYTEIKKQIEQSLGFAIEDVFSSIDESPIGTASIGIVHKAVLKSGESVVVKVRRPGIEQEIMTDLSLFRFITSQAERVSEDIKYLGVSKILKDFAISIQNELNFHIEALNCERLKKNLEQHDTQNIFYVPKVYKQYSSEAVLVMEFLEGIPFSHDEKIKPHLSQIQGLLEEGVGLFLKTFLQDGFFHADLHGGNFFYLKSNTIGLVDFGLMGSLSKKGRGTFIAIIYALLNFNYENIVYEFLDVAEYEKIPDIDDLITDVRDTLSPYIGLTVQQTNFSVILKLILGVLKKHQIHLPREWYIVFRAFMTLDGVGRSLDMDFDIYTYLEKDINEIISQSFKKEDLIEEAVWAGKDIFSSLRVFPRHLKWFIKDWGRKGYAIEVLHSGHEDAVNKLVRSIVFIGFVILTAIFFFSGVLVLPGHSIVNLQDVPILSWIFWAMSLILFSFSLFSIRMRI